MGKVRKFALVAMLSMLTAASASADGELPRQVLTNVTIIDPAERQVLDDAWVLLAGEEILSVGRGAVPPADVMHDLEGRYLLPGLVDAHLHLTAGPLEVIIEDGTPRLSMQSRDDMTRFNAKATLASGITTVFSPAGDPEANARYVTRQQAGEWLGPRLIHAGFTFEPMPIAGGSVYPGDAEAWRAEIARQQQLGVRYIKLYTGLSADELVQGIALAREAGLGSIAHLDEVSWQVAVDAGIDALTHALPTSPDLLAAGARERYLEQRSPVSARHLYQWFELVDFDSPEMQRLFTALVQRQVRVDLTLLVNEMMYFYPEIAARYPTEPWMQHPAFESSWAVNLGTSLHDWSDDDYARAQAAFDQVLEFAARLQAYGVPMLLGSDSVSGAAFFWRELELHQQAGFTPWQILSLITHEPARHLELTGLGRVVPGYLADFTVLEDNPLMNISAVRTVTHVVQAGRLYDVAKLRRELSVDAAGE